MVHRFAPARRPQFCLLALFYIITAAALYFSFRHAAAGTRYAALGGYLLVVLALAPSHWRSYRIRQHKRAHPFTAVDELSRES